MTMPEGHVIARLCVWTLIQRMNHDRIVAEVGTPETRYRAADSSQKPRGYASGHLYGLLWRVH